MHNHSPPPMFPCIAVNQPVGTFYITTGPARDFLTYLTVNRRGLSSEDRNKIQRALDPVRLKEIAKYVTRDDATFPTSITINADSQRVYVLSTDRGFMFVVGREVDAPATDQPNDFALEIKTIHGSRWFVRLDSDETPAEIIDGQHRFEGLRQAIRDASDDESLRNRLQAFELTLAVMFDLLPEQCAKVFVTINATQRKVDSSLIADLFALHTERSPQRVSHLIAVSANQVKGSPFEGGLKMLGRRVKEGQYLSQGSFTKYLMTLLPQAFDSGELKSQTLTAKDAESRPFSDLYREKEDSQIANIVLNFFKAVSVAYPTAWSEKPDDYLIRKTVGFAAFTKLLRKLAPHIRSDPHAMTITHLNAIIAAIKEGFAEDRWEVGKFASSDAQAGKIADEMYNIVKDKLPALLKDSKEKLLSSTVRPLSR